MKRYILLSFFALFILTGWAQTDTIRYVNPSNKSKNVITDGKTWATGYAHVQDAINSLHNYMKANPNVTSGSIYVMGGDSAIFSPLETTEKEASSIQNTAINIYDGIHVYGGFNPQNPESTPAERILVDEKNADNTITVGERDALDAAGTGSDIAHWSFKTPTIFTGKHGVGEVTFEWNDTEKKYNTRYPSSSYHVVWFGTAGEETDEESSTHKKVTGRRKAYTYGASLDGVTIQDGNANNKQSEIRAHNSYGGGVYMVKNTILRNCIVTHNSAAIKGGGVYLDGGGLVENCHIVENQSIGSGITDGMGGGVSIGWEGGIRKSYIEKNVARMGGGLNITHENDRVPLSWQTDDRNQYAGYATSCIITNNTSITEAGGVNIGNGGVIVNCTVAENENAGADVTYKNHRYGRSGGVYIDKMGVVYNTVIWGNKCSTNTDIQYAAYIQETTDENTKVNHPIVAYTAIANHDITNWNGTHKDNVLSLEKGNHPESTAASGHFPYFMDPSSIVGANGQTPNNVYTDWRISARSDLAYRAVQIQDIPTYNKIILHAQMQSDLRGRILYPISSCGAMECDESKTREIMMASVEESDNGQLIPTIFVDPNFNAIIRGSIFGTSWESPLTNVSEAINYFQKKYSDKGNNTQKVQILIKEGSINTTGPSSYVNNMLRSASLRPQSYMRIFGGYPSELTGTNTQQTINEITYVRNPLNYKTIVSANNINQGFNTNSVHVMELNNVHDVIVDGLTLEYGNSTSINSNKTLPSGGAITISNVNYDTNTEPTGRVNMDNIVIRNCTMRNCVAEESGAAVFANGFYYTGTQDDGADGNVALKNVCHISAKLLNCVINNNTNQSGTGIVTARGNAEIVMDHCTLVNNVGIPLQSMQARGYSGTINATNCAIFRNVTDSVNITDIENYIAPLATSQNTTLKTIIGNNNIVDKTITIPTSFMDMTNIKQVLGYDANDIKSYAQFENATQTVGARHNQDNITMYGGAPDFMPKDMNPMVNAATTDDSNATSTDLTTVNKRNIGGAPDAGAIENNTLPENGQVIYVRESDGVDDNAHGGSWGTALKTISAALERATYGQDIWVAAGKYYENLTMKEGVNVYGGFLNYGNPGKEENERNISNEDSEYQTIIDGDRSGRVLNQEEDFSKETIWEGFTIQNGLWASAIADEMTISENEVIVDTLTSAWSHGTYGTKIVKEITQNVTGHFTRHYNESEPSWKSGVGVNLMSNGTLKNCLIKDNLMQMQYPTQYLVKNVRNKVIKITIYTKDSENGIEKSTTSIKYDNNSSRIYNMVDGKYKNAKGGTEYGGAGIATTSGSKVLNCIIRNNVIDFSSLDGSVVANVSTPARGVGVLMDGGDIVNSLIVENYSNVGSGVLGQGIYIKSKSSLYSCTIAYNNGFNVRSNFTGAAAPGVWDDASNPNKGSGWAANASQFYNCIIWGNAGYGITGENYNNLCRTNWQASVGVTGFLHNCYHSTPSTYFAIEGVNNSHSAVTDSTLVYNTKNIDYNGVPEANSKYYEAAYVDAYRQSCYDANLFNEYNYPYFPDGSSDNNYSINRASDVANNCINMGADEWADEMDSKFNIIEDITGANRVQDCKIDKGAYEYDGTGEITPVIEGNSATYYVTENGAGTAKGTLTEPACMQKLQKILDAAGRYKYANPTSAVTVKLASIPDGHYYPTRTTQENYSTINPRNFSIIVPRGVKVMGGYLDTDNFASRNIIDNRTILSAKYTSENIVTQSYHAVTFTDHVFDINQNLEYEDDGVTPKSITKKLIDTYGTTLIDTIQNIEQPNIRAVLDGLYIEDGSADGINTEDQIGGGAIIPDYAMIQNCIIQNNNALTEGGGLYLQKRALVIGCIVENNSADYGGGIAVVDNNDMSENAYLSYPYVVSSTVVNNTATTRGGGIYFLNNFRTNSSVYWANTSNDQADLSGVTTTTNGLKGDIYPVTYCAITNQIADGSNNISVDADETKGVRWNNTDDDKYYSLQVLSQLTRGGMSYANFRRMQESYPSIDSLDINGLSRMAVSLSDYNAKRSDYDGNPWTVKSNSYIEIGARVVNYAFMTYTSQNITPDNLMTRIFVAHTEYVEPQRAIAWQQSDNTMYKQVGSSFANPFLRLDDALEYVAKARQSSINNINNTRFEIFLAQGRYFPYTNIDRNNSSARGNTFLIPEKVTIIGSIDVSRDDHMYCQSSTIGQDITITSNQNTYTLKGCTTDSIRAAREHIDFNKNSIYELWEMAAQTTLSGEVTIDDNTPGNVNHVISIINDDSKTGKSPDMFTGTNLINGETTLDRTKESQESMMSRIIIIDGIKVTNGNASEYTDTTVYNLNGYFRGGGMYIDGNPETTVFANSDEQHKLTRTIETNAMERGVRDKAVLLANCIFQNNNAIQGGAIFSNGTLYISGSEFVQNTTVGPSGSTANTDNCYVSYSGGGAIASNSDLLMGNCLLANNEALYGDVAITINADDVTLRNGKTINKNANQYQGYGGAIWLGDESAIYMMNTDIVRNKSVGYPCIFNSIPNRSDNIHHYAINNVFWGNEISTENNDTLKTIMNIEEWKGVDKAPSIFFNAFESGQAHTPYRTLDPKYKRINFTGNFQDIAPQLRETQEDGTVIQYDMNILLDSDNDALDGPNFKEPTVEAGADGYMEQCNWMLSRINNLCDNGWGYLEQDENGKFIKNSDGSYAGGGYYNYWSRLTNRYSNLTLVPLGDEIYMEYSNVETDLNESNKRISKDPLHKKGLNYDYIDMGLYEYQHTILALNNSHEVDTIWVAPSEVIGQNDGKTWKTPTSDLQRAIEVLLMSRNDHPKVLNIEAGTYSPAYVMNDNLGYTIALGDYNNNSIELKDTVYTGIGYGIKSLTINGGWNTEAEEWNPETYQVILKPGNIYGSTTNHILNIVDVENRETEMDVKEDKITHPTFKTVPITINGITFINNTGQSTSGGSSINYQDQYCSESKTETATKTTIPLNPNDNDDPKLIIKNCIFRENGIPGNTTAAPAVTIGTGGGQALIYNSLFHSNIGIPVKAVDTKITNCTFALNGGHTQLSESGYTYTLNSNEENKTWGPYTSELHNCIIWKDDTLASTKYAQQYELTHTGNQIDEGSEYNSYNAVYGIENTKEDQAHYYNVGLGDNNSLVLYGPNFIAPFESNAADCNFKIRPADHTCRRANARLFAEKALLRNFTGMSDEAIQDSVVTDLKHQTDLSGTFSRYYGKGMERGAYENVIDLQRIYYVKQNQAFNPEVQDGKSWNTAFGGGHLQDIIDGATLYVHQNTDKKKSYVLVNGQATEPQLTIRDGVNLYGSIHSLIELGDTLNMQDNEKENAITDMINHIKADRRGMASETNSANATRIRGLITEPVDNKDNILGSIIDGFIIENDSIAETPAIELDNDRTTLRNLIIQNNKNKGEALIRIKNGLLYNSLIYNNTATTLVDNQGGVLLNNTIIANQADGITVDNKSGEVINTLMWNTATGTSAEKNGNGTFTTSNTASQVNPFIPYMDNTLYAHQPTAYTIYPTYYYQLHEASSMINAGTNITTPSGELIIGNKHFSHDAVNFATDRDILGNPRLLGKQDGETSNHIDIGAFEVWNISDHQNVYTENTTNTEANLTEDDDSYRTYTKNYGGNFYPHAGSVMYIGRGARFNFNKNASETPIFDADNAFMPSYLLLKDSASLYGNRNVIRASYVAIEKTLKKGDRYKLMSLPFNEYYWDNVNVVSSQDGNITLSKFDLTNAVVKTYNGETRSAWNYKYQTENSSCWEDVHVDTPLQVGEGWMIDYGRSLNEDQTIRMTAFAKNNNSFAYEEDGSDKQVILTQHNTIDRSGTAHFTRAENMGWNFIGLPYLVSNYNTATGQNGKYQMHIPHVLYGVNSEDGTYQSADQMVTLPSWEEGSEITMGDGYFTQTATQSDTEKVTFRLPINPEEPTQAAAKPNIMLTAENGTKDAVKMAPSAEATSITYSVGNGGVKWDAINDTLPEIYANASDGTRMSWVPEAPVEQELGIGIKAAKTGNYTISLPEVDAFDQVSNVWLIDHATGTVTDLKDNAYQLTISKAGTYDNRLAIKFGGMQPTGIKTAEASSTLSIYVENTTLHVKGIEGAEDVNIYTISGKLYSHAHQVQNEYTKELHPGVYIVKVKNTTKTIAVKSQK